MKCPVCGGLSQVVDTRGADSYVVWRRRRCSECGLSFHTTEEVMTEHEKGVKRQRRKDIDKLGREVVAKLKEMIDGY